MTNNRPNRLIFKWVEKEFGRLPFVICSQAKKARGPGRQSTVGEPALLHHSRHSDSG